MSLKSISLLDNTADNRSVVGAPIRVDEGYGHAGRVYTIAIHVSNFVGFIHIEASLVGEPTADDWFNVVLPFEFPRVDARAQPGETATVGLTFTGNFAWIRARMHRDGLPEMPTGVPNPYGFVDRILVNV